MSTELDEREIAAAIHREWSPSAGAQALAKLATHEEICGIRYKTILDRVARLEGVVIWATSALIVAMGGIIGTLLFHGPK